MCLQRGERILKPLEHQKTVRISGFQDFRISRGLLKSSKMNPRSVGKLRKSYNVHMGHSKYQGCTQAPRENVMDISRDLIMKAYGWVGLHDIRLDPRSSMRQN